MENTLKTKQILIILFIFILVSGIAIMVIRNKKVTTNNTNIPSTVAEQPIKMCYYRFTKTNSGLYDKAWLKLNITGNNISGEFNNIPAEKDSKVGTFEGTVGPVDQTSMSRKAEVWWNSMAKGMTVKEELILNFGEGSANAGFGEMVDRGDGIYVYKDKTKLFYLDQLNQIDCQYLDEKIFVDKYIKENIATLAINKPVLGGTWHVISVVVNEVDDTAVVVYEDGHIQSTANIEYSFQDDPQDVTIKKFEIIK